MADAQICNMALGHAGYGTAPVSDLDTDQTAEARVLRVFYEQARKMCLEAYDWGFARRREALALHGTAPPSTWGYRYAYPATCLAPRSIPMPGADYPSQQYKIETLATGEKTILTNAGEAELIFTADLQESGPYTAWFKHAFSLLLAHFIARPTTGKRDIKNDLFQLYDHAIRVAPAHEANQEKDPEEAEASWISVR